MPDIYGTVPFTEKMKDELAKTFKQIIDLRYVTMILDKDEKPVCFGLCFPSVSRAVQKSGGRMTPCHHRAHSEGPEKARDHRTSASSASCPPIAASAIVMIDEITRMLTEGSAKYCETNLNLEDNHAILNLWMNFGNVLHKRRRCYIKKL